MGTKTLENKNGLGNQALPRVTHFYEVLDIQLQTQVIQKLFTYLDYLSL